ncbi:MAG: ArsR/SmtB family transcription factor [Pseudomonadota bacterium]
MGGPSRALADRRREAAEFLKTLGHEGRLMILCHLSEGEKSVTELETLLDSRQSAVSQQLARLRMEGLVKWRREGKAIHYALADPRTRVMLDVIQMLFCPDDESGEAPVGGEGRP